LLQTLRENQQMQRPKVVPYRDSSLTMLFKNYFAGDGQVISSREKERRNIVEEGRRKLLFFKFADSTDFKIGILSFLSGLCQRRKFAH
jgi:hypothetical protein